MFCRHELRYIKSKDSGKGIPLLLRAKVRNGVFYEELWPEIENSGFAVIGNPCEVFVQDPDEKVQTSSGEYYCYKFDADF